MSRAAVYERVTRAILERLEAGVAPWHQPWRPELGAPRNLVSGRPYSGVNALALGMTGRPPYWLTFRQIQAKGLRLRAGSKGAPIIFAKKTQGDEERDRFLVRYYFVFNAGDVDGLELPAPAPAGPGLPKAEAILDGVRPLPDIRPGTRACFLPEADQVFLPPRHTFESPEAYYATAFHELTHWSGHPARLNRDTMSKAAPFGSPVYSQEELVAEMGAGFLCALAGIENRTIDQSASYLASWLKVLKADPGMLVRAASQAQRAVDFLAPTATAGERGLEADA